MEPQRTAEGRVSARSFSLSPRDGRNTAKRQHVLRSFGRGIKAARQLIWVLLRSTGLGRNLRFYGLPGAICGYWSMIVRLLARDARRFESTSSTSTVTVYLPASRAVTSTVR